MERDAVIVAGFGFRESATVDSLADALAKACDGREVDCIATATDKAAHDAFQALAARTDLPVRTINPEVMAEVTPVTNSEISRKHRATGSLCEASALAAAGAKARLLGPRVISDDRLATCALARGDDI